MRIIQRERHQAAEERIKLIKLYEAKIRKEREEIQAECEKRLKNEIDIKNTEINDLKKILNSIKIFGENLQILSGEFEMELRSLLMLMGKMQNRFVNIQFRAETETKKIEKKCEKIENN